ncbi:MAG: hypothetical protein OHK0029_30430 [Armatimonadaceae bacterium]
MDSKQVSLMAASTAAILGPYAKALQAGDTSACDPRAEPLWKLIEARSGNYPAAREALSDMHSDPNDADAKAGLRWQVRKMATTEAGFGCDLAAVLSHE